MQIGKFIRTNIYEYLSERHLIKEGVKLNDNFWKWFGESEAIDDNGNPIVFYHGSDRNKRFKKFHDDMPIWFTDYEGYAKAFTTNKGKIFKVFLRIENPLYVGPIDGIANDKKINYLSELTNINSNILKDILKESNGVNLFNITNSIRFKKIVEDMGYDGLEAKEGGGLTTYAVFKSNQIKSIKNDGSWDINDDNINS